MTDSELEFEIERACEAMLLADDPNTARAWARNMADLVAQRSDEVVERMEQSMGLR